MNEYTDTDPTAAVPDSSSTPNGALEGIRVLEIGTLIAGPFAGRLLGAWVGNGFLGSRARLVEVNGPRVLIRRRVGGEAKAHSPVGKPG